MKNLAKNESYRTRTLTRHRYKQENPINENCPHGHRQAHGKIKDEVPRHDTHKVTANEGQEHGGTKYQDKNTNKKFQTTTTTQQQQRQERKKERKKERTNKQTNKQTHETDQTYRLKYFKNGRSPCERRVYFLFSWLCARISTCSRYQTPRMMRGRCKRSVTSKASGSLTYNEKKGTTAVVF